MQCPKYYTHVLCSVLQFVVMSVIFIIFQGAMIGLWISVRTQVGVFSKHF